VSGGRAGAGGDIATAGAGGSLAGAGNTGAGGRAGAGGAAGASNGGAGGLIGQLAGCHALPVANALCNTVAGFPRFYACVTPYTAPSGCRLRNIGNVTDQYCCP
jgi:hypothetical protein